MSEFRYHWRVWRAFEDRKERPMNRAISLAIRDACRVNGKVDVDELDRLLTMWVEAPVVDA